jgi:hypothetical protein
MFRRQHHEIHVGPAYAIRPINLAQLHPVCQGIKRTPYGSLSS